jgi:hypothetical protein
MKTTRDGSTTRIVLDGPLGETSTFFTMLLKDTKELVVDMAEMTYMNSIGVKHWILWTLRLPKDCKVRLIHCPLMIASQASTVVGFMTPKMRIESLRVPYVCESCGAEKILEAAEGRDFHYGAVGARGRVNLPADQPCPKCAAGKLEPDLLIEKTFKFLNG